MSLTPLEIMETLGVNGTSGARAVVDLAKLELSDDRYATIFRQLAGDDAAVPDRVGAVVAYIVYDAARGLPFDVAGAIQRAANLADYNFTDAAAKEREAAKAERAVKSADKEAKKAVAKAERSEKAATATVLRDAAKAVAAAQRADAPKSGRGRKRGEGPTTFDKVCELYRTAPDNGKEAMIPRLQAELGLPLGTATTYWYKAKKELAA